MSKVLAIASAALMLAAVSITSEAMPIAPLPDGDSAIMHVADGCGWARYRGPGGACHRYGRGPYPGGYFGPYFWHPDRCPPGYWRGPWGHCRDTPFHGYLPGGAYKP